jgi:hypothetical protein
VQLTGPTGNRGAGGTPPGQPQPGGSFDWKAPLAAVAEWLGGPCKVIASVIASVICVPWRLVRRGDNWAKRVVGAVLLLMLLLSAWEALALTPYSQFALHPLIAACFQPDPSFDVQTGVLRPRYCNVLLALQGIPDKTTVDSFSVSVGEKCVDPSDLTLRTGVLVVPASAFRWGMYADDKQTIELFYKEEWIGRKQVALAEEPLFVARESQTVHALDGSRPALRELEQSLRSAGADGAMYLVGRDGVDVNLPSEVAKAPKHFALRLFRGIANADLPLAGDKVHLSTEQLLLGVRAPYGHTYGNLCCDGEPHAVIDFVLFAAPLLENRRLPPGKDAHWDYDAQGSPDMVRAHDDLIITPRRDPPHYNVYFEAQRVPAAEGLWILELNVQGLGEGTMALAIRDVLEFVMPAGVGERHADLKLHEQLFAAAGPEAWSLRFAPWNGVVTLDDDLWHTLTLVVRIWWEPDTGLYCWKVRGYIDDVCIGEATVCSETLPASLEPEFRLRGARGTIVHGVREYFVPA